MYRFKKFFLYFSVTLTLFGFIQCSKTNHPKEPLITSDPKQEELAPIPSTVSIDVVDLVTKKSSLIKSLISTNSKTLAKGISIVNMKYVNSSHRNMSIHVIIADFVYKNVTAQVLNPFNLTENRFQNLPEMVKVNEEAGTKIWAAINGDYFSWSNMQTTGPFIHDGIIRKSNPNGSNRPAFGITRTGVPVFLNPPVGQSPVFQYGDNLLRHLVGGNQWFIYNGNKLPINDSTVEPRTAIGMRDDKKVIAITIDGRQSAYSNGMSYLQLQSLFEALGAKFAFNLDGGGSTVAVVRKNEEAVWDVVNSPSEIPLRALANGIGFVSVN